MSGGGGGVEYGARDTVTLAAWHAGLQEVLELELCPSPVTAAMRHTDHSL